jgi:hypothetical protein
MDVKTIKQGSALIEGIDNTKARIKALQSMLAVGDKRGLSFRDGVNAVHFYTVATPNMITDILNFATEKLVNHREYLEGQLRDLK